MAGDYAVGDVAALLRHASMSASYKPALLKALVRVTRASSELQIPLGAIGEQFARMYWNQTIVYHLRQASSLTKEAEVIKEIRRAANVHRVRNYGDLPLLGRERLCSGMARVLTINVLDAFHRSSPASMQPLYAWRKGVDQIVLTAGSHAFLKENGGALETLANYYWAAFLESRNRLAPFIIRKVERDGPSRASLSPFLRILTEDGAAACFYCERPFGESVPVTVDHVIPRAFLLEDPLWDLVLACAPCNGAKSDWLPEEAFIERLIRRNATKLKTMLAGKASLLDGGQDALRLYQAAVSLEWPRYWRPG